MKQKITPPQTNSLWTHKGGEDVIVNTCCDLSSAGNANREKPPLVIYTNKQGECHSHPLETWHQIFRPSVAQQAINSTAIAAWSLAISTSINMIDDTINQTDMTLLTASDLASELKLNMSELDAAGVARLQQANLITDSASPIRSTFGASYADRISAIYDATLRANPQPGFIFSQELLAMELDAAPKMKESEFYAVIAKQLTELRITQGILSPSDREKTLVELMTWPLNGFPS
jgi:hypothetical protein